MVIRSLSVGMTIDSSGCATSFSGIKSVNSAAGAGWRAVVIAMP